MCIFAEPASSYIGANFEPFFPPAQGRNTELPTGGFLLVIHLRLYAFTIFFLSLYCLFSEFWAQVEIQNRPSREKNWIGK